MWTCPLCHVENHERGSGCDGCSKTICCHEGHVQKLDRNRTNCSVCQQPLQRTPLHTVLNEPQTSRGGSEVVSVVPFEGSTRVFPRISDISQGNIGNCWLLATCAALIAVEPSHVGLLFVTQGNIISKVRLCDFGSWRTIDVGDHSFATYQWCRALEVAVMRLSPEVNPHGGSSAEAFFLVTNRPTKILSKDEPNTIWSNTTVRLTLEEIHQRQCPATATCGQSCPDTRLVNDHEYAIVAVDMNSSFIQLFNPWGDVICLSFADFILNFVEITMCALQTAHEASVTIEHFMPPEEWVRINCIRVKHDCRIQFTCQQRSARRNASVFSDMTIVLASVDSGGVFSFLFPKRNTFKLTKTHIGECIAVEWAVPEGVYCVFPLSLTGGSFRFAFTGEAQLFRFNGCLNLRRCIFKAVSASSGFSRKGSTGSLENGCATLVVSLPFSQHRVITVKGTGEGVHFFPSRNVVTTVPSGASCLVWIAAAKPYRKRFSFSLDWSVEEVIVKNATNLFQNDAVFSPF